MVRVLTRPPTPRDEFKPITGIIELKIKVAEDSYLFIGSGKKALSFDEKELERLKAVSNLDMIRSFALRLSYDFETFQKIGDNFSIVGSSVKGAVRTRLEFLFKSVNGEVPACFRVYRMERIPPRFLSIWGKVVEETRPPCNYQKEGKVCEICDIFGAPGLQSLVMFTNFISEGNEKKFERVTLITGEKIIGAKPGTTFNGRIIFRNLKDYQLGLVFLAMRIQERKPILMGKFKYRPVKDANGRILKFGRVYFSIMNIQLHIADETTKQLAEDTEEFVKTMVDKAKMKFEKYLRVEFDEVKRVNEIASET